jgi:hypothetical protein
MGTQTMRRRGEVTYRGKVGYYRAVLVDWNGVKGKFSSAVHVHATQAKFHSADAALMVGSAIMSQHAGANYVVVERLVVDEKLNDVYFSLVRGVEAA